MSYMSREIAFIDPSIPELDTFLSGLRPGLEAVLLSPKQGAPAQIANALRGRAGLDAIHIVAHGKAGEVSFGAGALSLETLKEHTDDLAKIGEALAPHGALSLWACETGKGQRGEAFIEALSGATGAAVGAAAHRIGPAAKGGSWKLDAGCVASVQAPLTREATTRYSGVLTISFFISSLPAAYTENHTTTPILTSASIFTPDELLLQRYVTSITISVTDYNHTEFLAAMGGSWNSAAGILTISFSSFTDDIIWQNALNSLVYMDITNNNPTATRSLSIQAFESTGASVTRPLTINITPVNDAPTASITLADYISLQQAVLNLKGTGLSIDDVDANGGAMTVTLSVTDGTLTAAAGDSLANVVGSGTSSLTITGTLTQLNAFLGASGTSTLSYLKADAGSATLTLAVHDNGNTGATIVDLSASDTALIDVIAADEAPKATIVLNSSFLTELFWSPQNVVVGTHNDTTFEFSVSTFPGPWGTGNFWVRVTGSDLTYSGGTNPAAGTYTSIEAFSDAGFTNQVATYDAATSVDFGSYFTQGASAALAGADTINGSSGTDILIGRAGTDALDGKDGGDQYFFFNGDLGPGEIIDDTGASGTDFIIAAGTSVDFTAAATIGDIEGLGFSQQNLGQTAIFNASQFGGAQISTDLTVQGNSQGVDTIVINNAANFTAAGWTFTSWDSTDVLAFNGTVGADSMVGSGQRDTLTGGLGKDTMTGGLGADIFNFDLKTETPKGANRDVIMDFSGVVGGEFDLIDLAGIDAKKGPGNQAFKFIGKQAFHHKAGELQVKYNAVSDVAIVSGDINGDGKADFQIEVHSLAALVKADFIL